MPVAVESVAARLPHGHAAPVAAHLHTPRPLIAQRRKTLRQRRRLPERSMAEAQPRPPTRGAAALAPSGLPHGMGARLKTAMWRDRSSPIVNRSERKKSALHHLQLTGSKEECHRHPIRLERATIGATMMETVQR
ncbi:hypothetical protein ZWY2020_018704 [Hordeum vulgare]|nr:hypothetical protein ZWY2020_018704 [Hordeum vulgare]